MSISISLIRNLSFTIFILFNLTTKKLFADSIVKIWPHIPFVAGANLCSTVKELNTNRVDTRKSYIFETISLMRSGALPLEALTILSQFDSYYNQHIYESEAKLKISLESLLKSEVQKLFNYYNPVKQKFEFNNSTAAIKLQSRLVDYFNPSTNPRKIDEDKLPVHEIVDYIASGTFGFTSDCTNNIYISLELLELETGKIISFSASGTITSAIRNLAEIIFHNFQKPSFPSTIKIDGDKKIKILGTPNGRFTDKVDWTTANRACHTLKGRLPTSQEVKDISLLGSYSGGLTLIKHGNYSLDGENNVYISDFEGQEEQNFNYISEKKAYFFCVTSNL